MGGEEETAPMAQKKNWRNDRDDAVQERRGN